MLDCLWNKRVSADEPDRTTKKYETVIINRLNEINVKTQGRYLTKTGQPRGLIVHYTAGRSFGLHDAENTLKSMAKRGLGCMTMDRIGDVFSAQDKNQVAWHAGKSSAHGVTGLSRYCAGMEMCNAGKLEPSRSINGILYYKSWFGEEYPVGDVRERYEQYYHKYSEAQEQELFNYCMQELDTNPEFNVDWVMGHNEISPGRKTDPGGSLSITMPEFRDKLRKGQW